MPRPAYLAFALLVLLAIACTGLTSVTPPAPTAPATALPATSAPATGTPEPTATNPPPVTTEAPTAVPVAPGTLPEPALFDVAWDDRAPFRGDLIPSEAGDAQLPALAGASVYHLDVTIGDDLTQLHGREEVRYTNRAGGSLDEIYFHLFPNLLGGRSSVAGLQVNGAPVDPVYEKRDSILRVTLPEPLPDGEQVVVSLNFDVEVPTQQEGNYGAFAYYADVLALAHFYPLIAAYDAEGWHTELPAPAGDIVYADASFYLVRLTVPGDLVLIGSGDTVDLPVREEAQAGQKIITLAAGPVRDFYLAGSRDFEVTSRQVGDTTINSYALPEFTEGRDRVLDFAAAALEDYNKRFGAYPYRELDMVGTPNQALGIEYPGVIAINTLVYDPSVSLGDTPSSVYLESTTAHEVSHQWFYGVVGDDQLNEPWLDEAMAQYVTMLYYGDIYGPSGAEEYKQTFYQRWDRVDREETPIGLPVGAYSESEYSAIVYGRGPLFLVALADQIGQDTMDAFLRDYYAHYAYGIVTTEDFKAMAEEHCGCDLTALFTVWVYPQP